MVVKAVRLIGLTKPLNVSLGLFSKSNLLLLLIKNSQNELFLNIGNVCGVVLLMSCYQFK